MVVVLCFYLQELCREAQRWCRYEENRRGSTRVPNGSCTLLSVLCTLKDLIQ